MSDFSSRIIVVLMPILLAISATPILAMEYAPGVSVGHYVKFGNIVDSRFPGGRVTIAWMMMEVVAVTGSEVTLRSSGQFTNGSAIPPSGATTIYNVENGTMNGTTYSVYGPIITANLNEGDAIPPISSGLKVSKTETREYLGVSRSVNILNTTIDSEDYATRWTIVYDRASGMMLEMEYEYIQKKTVTTTKISYSVIETNIFAPPTPTSTATRQPPADLGYTMYYVIGGIIAVIIIAAIIWLVRRK